MFTEGRISFIIFFVVVFALGLIWAYRKDIQKSRQEYKGAWKFLISFIIIGAILQFIVKVIF